MKPRYQWALRKLREHHEQCRKLSPVVVSRTINKLSRRGRAQLRRYVSQEMRFYRVITSVLGAARLRAKLGAGVKDARTYGQRLIKQQNLSSEHSTRSRYTLIDCALPLKGEDDGRVILPTLHRFPDTGRYVDVRYWVHRDETSELVPTRKGISIPLDLAPQVAEALMQLYRKWKEKE